MAPLTANKPSRVVFKDGEHSSDEEGFNGFNDRTGGTESDKDSTEEELERLVFGDAAGFRKGIKAFKEAGELSKGKELVLAEAEDEDADTGLGAIDDADLFFLDSGPSDIPAQPFAEVSSSDEEDLAAGREPPAWSDSDDERIAVSLASRPQLRKLRRSEAEDFVSGKEYSRRLRKQFQILNPVPEWVHSSVQHRPKKKRRTSSGSSLSESSSEDEMDVDDEELSAQPLARLLQDADSLTRRTADNGTSRKRKLRPEVIDIQRMKDITSSGPSAITTLQIHPTLPLLISSGPSSTVAIHHLQPQPPNPNPLLTTLHIKHTPISTAFFHPSASDPRIFLGARRRYFHVWNLATGAVEKVSRIYGHQDSQRSFETFKLSPDGKAIAVLGSSRKGGGVLNILDANTLQWVSQARIESHGGIADFCWWADSTGICVAGKNGEISEWHLASGVAIARWKDEGAVGTTTIALGGVSGREGLGGDRWCAIGSSAGIVNIYDRRAWSSSTSTASNNEAKDSSTSGTSKSAVGAAVPKNPTPLRVLDNLTTPISHLAFSPGSGELLVMASRWKNDALRLVHMPSCSVYKNWPTGKTPLGRVSSVVVGEMSLAADGDAGGDGELVVLVGNEKGAVRGWEVRG